MAQFDSPSANLSAVVEEIVLNVSDEDYTSRLVSVIGDSDKADNAAELIDILDRVAEDREKTIEKICNTNYITFVDSVKRLLDTRDESAGLTREILGLSVSIEKSIREVLNHKRKLVNWQTVSDNIELATEALNRCLEVLQSANSVRGLLANKDYYTALRALERSQNVHLRAVKQYYLAELIEVSVPETQERIKRIVNADLKDWLSSMVVLSQAIGEYAMHDAHVRIEGMEAKIGKDSILEQFDLSSALHLVLDEKQPSALDLFLEERRGMFKPLLSSVHIFEALGGSDSFRAEYAKARRDQSERIIPDSMDLHDRERMDLVNTLERVTGFVVVERLVMKETDSLRSHSDVESLWDFLSKATVKVVSEGLKEVHDRAILVDTHENIDRFVEAVSNWGYPVDIIKTIHPRILEQFVAIAKREAMKRIDDAIEQDQCTQLVVMNEERYKQVCAQTWYKSPEGEPTSFPSSFYFSDLFPAVCEIVRRFTAAVRAISNTRLKVDESVAQIISEALDDILRGHLWRRFSAILNSTESSNIIASLFNNLSALEQTVDRMADHVFRSDRPARRAEGTDSELARVKKAFSEGAQRARGQLFKLVNAKIAELVATDLTYHWDATQNLEVPVNAIDVVSGYLTASMIGIPPSTGRSMAFMAVAQMANQIVALIMSPDVQRITPAAVQSVGADMVKLQTFVGMQELEGDPLKRLKQIFAVMSLADPTSFYDTRYRMANFPDVSDEDGKAILAKTIPPRSPEPTGAAAEPAKAEKTSTSIFSFGR